MRSRLGEGGGALDDVLELPHVPGKRVLLEDLEGVLGEKLQLGRPSSLRQRSRNSFASTRMSPGRSRSGGSSIVITLSR